MKRTVYIFFALCLSLTSTGKKETALKPEKQDHKISEIQQSLIKEKTKTFPENTQLSVAIIHGDKTAFYGFICNNDTLTRIENHKSIFETGSITKIFTSVLLAELIYDSTITGHMSIQEFFDFDLKSGKEINLLQLASHTSGLPRLPSNFVFSSANVLNPYQNYDVDKLYDYLKNHVTLNHQPGTRYEYSNLGTGLLGYLLSLHTQKSYEELLQQKVFRKYNMSNSSTIRSQTVRTIVPGLDPYGNVTPYWDFDVLAGAGAVLSCTEDLAKFVSANFDGSNPVLTLTHKPVFKVNDRMKTGLGWHIIKTDKKSDVLWHNGGTGGFTSSMAVDTDRPAGVIILSNVSAFHNDSKLIDELCFELLNTVQEY